VTAQEVFTAIRYGKTLFKAMTGMKPDAVLIGAHALKPSC
jgi:hypothetical protein